MRNKKLITLLILYALAAISPFSLKLFDNKLRAQSDAFFYGSSPDDRDGNAGFDFNDFSPQQGLGFNFGGFDGNGGNGFNFDDFNGSEGGGFSFDNFNHNPDNAPLGNGILLLAGCALLWRKRKNMRDEH